MTTLSSASQHLAPAALAEALAARLPRVDAGAARLGRLGADRRLGPWLAGQLGHGGARIVSTRPGEGWRFTVRCGAGQLTLAVPKPLSPALELACSLPDAATSIDVLNVLLAPWAEPLHATLGPLRVTHIGPQQALPDPRPEIAAGVHLIDIDEEAASHIDQALRCGPKPASQAFARLRVPAAVRLFTQPMTPVALRSLSRGDVVVAPAPWRLGDAWRAVMVFGGEPRMQAEAELDTAHSTARLATAITPAAEPNLDDLGELVLPVSFEIDRARVTLDELASLGEGSVLELDVPITQATVRLVCQGQTVGSGQLVAIGERLGVRIARMGLGTPGGAG